LYPHPNLPQLDLGRRADSRWALPQISRLFMFCYQFFVQLRDALASRCEILHYGHYYAELYNAGPKFRAAHPKKILGAKNMQNLAGFRTTLKFGGEYLRNGCRYLKSDFYFIYRDSSCVRRNKTGELWSSNLGDLVVNSYPPKAPFSEEHTSHPRGCCAPKFYTR